MNTGYKILAIILGILMIVSGIYCLCTPGLTFLAVGWIIGFNMVADAIGALMGWHVVVAGINLISTAWAA